MTASKALQNLSKSGLHLGNEARPQFGLCVRQLRFKPEYSYVCVLSVFPVWTKHNDPGFRSQQDLPQYRDLLARIGVFGAY
jgi:hypothetical protein